MYTIYIVSPPTYAHSETFAEIADAFEEGLKELNHEAKVVRQPNEIEGRCIILGAHLLPSFPDIIVPDDAIIYNLEQTPTGWFTTAYVDLLRKHEVWDYSTRNVEWLKTYGIEAKFCGVGYAPCLTRIIPKEPEIDVLFYGSVFGRRIEILNAIQATGLRVKTLFGVYGRARDDWIARSTAILNIHAYEDSPPEVVRLSYLWANRCFVVSEGDVLGTACGKAEDLPRICKQYIEDPIGRQIIARQGFLNFQAKRQADYLKPLLTASPTHPPLRLGLPAQQ